MQRLFLYFIILFLFSCSKDKTIYSVKGTIVSIDSEKEKVVIAHDTIRGLMEPMIMPFFVPELNDRSNLKIGDSVHFQFVWNDSLPFARNFKNVGIGIIPEFDDFWQDEFSMKQIGQRFDDVTLLTIDSNNVNLSDSDGKFRFLSFIFTQCPMPNMCPMVIIKNQGLVNQFPDTSILDFILVSFDYKYDTPSILKTHYGSLENEFNNMFFWSSTGHIEDVYKLISQCGGKFWGVEERKIGHDLVSVLISPERKLLAYWKGDDWSVNDVSNMIKVFIK